MSLLLVDIPDETLRLIASFLTAKDVLQFLSSNRHLALTLGHSESFWRLLLGNNNDNDTPVVKEPFFDYEDAKVSYLTKAYTQALPSVAWKPCFASRQSPSSREGHFACKLGPCALFTGGFTNDEHVYLLDTRDFTEEEEDWQKLEPTAVECWRHPNNNNNNNNAPSSMRAPENVNPLVETNPEHSPARVYGASLTALDDHRAVRFGGFRGGGYTGETGEVALLTVQGQDEEEEENKKAVWQVIQTHNEGMPVGLPRAYHTATLISNRYLLILGGMISSGCIRGEAVLDTKTWTWLTDVPITQEMKQPKPSGRHGTHSIVQYVLFCFLFFLLTFLQLYTTIS